MVNFKTHKPEIQIGRGGKLDVTGLSGKQAVKALEDANKILGNGISCNILRDKDALDKFVKVLKDARKVQKEQDVLFSDGLSMRYKGLYRLGDVVAKLKRNCPLDPKEANALRSSIETLMRSFEMKDVDPYVVEKAIPTARKIVAELEKVQGQIEEIDAEAYSNFKDTARALQ